MKILILSFYYPPDLGAGAFRAEALVHALREVGGESLHIDVMTTHPNRYPSHFEAAESLESKDQTVIHRFKLPAHQGGLRDQSLSYLSYARAVQHATKGGDWDIIVATSSRLMTAALGAYVAKKVNAKLYLDIRDLFVDTFSDVFKKSPVRILLPFLRWLERRTIRFASRVSAVSPGFLGYLLEVDPHCHCSVFTNGIDGAFLERDFRKPEREPSKPLLVVYAGNIGDGQGLHHVMPSAAKKLEGWAVFRVIGDGARLQDLRSEIGRFEVGNIDILPPLPRTALLDHYQEADVLLLSLNDHPAFLKVLPSKLFEYVATGKPIVAGVSGCAAEFLEENAPGVELFQPCDPDGLVEALGKFDDAPSNFSRPLFCREFSRDKIMREMAKDILGVSETG